MKTYLDGRLKATLMKGEGRYPYYAVVSRRCNGQLVYRTRNYSEPETPMKIARLLSIKIS